MNPQHTGKAKQIRGRLRAREIKAKCSAYVSCGTQYIRISKPTFDAPDFTKAQQREILIICKVNGLTLSRGGEIDENRMTYPEGGHFELPPER